MAGNKGPKTRGTRANRIHEAAGCEGIDGLVDQLNDALDSLNRTAIDLGRVSDISMNGIQMLGALCPNRFTVTPSVMLIQGAGSTGFGPSHPTKNH